MQDSSILGKWGSLVLFSRTRWATAQMSYFQSPLQVVLNCFGSLVCLAWDYINRSGLREGFFLSQVTGQFWRVFAWPISWNCWHFHCWTVIILGLRQTFHSSSKYLQKTTPTCTREKEEGQLAAVLPPLTRDFESADKMIVTVLISIITCVAYQNCWFAICMSTSLTVSATLYPAKGQRMVFKMSVDTKCQIPLFSCSKDRDVNRK